jgi:hypothetical protein
MIRKTIVALMLMVGVVYAAHVPAKPMPTQTYAFDGSYMFWLGYGIDDSHCAYVPAENKVVCDTLYYPIITKTTRDTTVIVSRVELKTEEYLFTSPISFSDMVLNKTNNTLIILTFDKPIYGVVNPPNAIGYLLTLSINNLSVVQYYTYTDSLRTTWLYWETENINYYTPVIERQHIVRKAAIISTQKYDMLGRVIKTNNRNIQSIITVMGE